MLSARPSPLYTSYRINTDRVSFIRELLEKRRTLPRIAGKRVRAELLPSSSRRARSSLPLLVVPPHAAVRCEAPVSFSSASSELSGSRVSLVKGSLWTALC
ncbi:hypothetical protein QQF64_007477 [Cirrhinus molitorella]|uniref:Uncharacterized protein n=1 Tax=Cirrhinus molitorella TaxID=172907 RepID=A0ABR3ME35_9TELE